MCIFPSVPRTAWVAGVSGDTTTGVYWSEAKDTTAKNRTARKGHCRRKRCRIIRAPSGHVRNERRWRAHVHCILRNNRFFQFHHARKQPRPSPTDGLERGTQAYRNSCDKLTYQIFTRSSGARYSVWPGFTSKSEYQASMLRTVSARYWAGECESTITWLRKAASRPLLA